MILVSRIKFAKSKPTEHNPNKERKYAMKKLVRSLPLVAAALCVAGAALAGPDGSPRVLRRLESAPRAAEAEDDILGATEQWLQIRTAPAPFADSASRMGFKPRISTWRMAS